MPNILMALSLLSLTVSSYAFADDAWIVEKAQRACFGDTAKFCRAVMDQDASTVVLCLKEHRAKLSRDCNALLVSHGL